ncbi:MAG: ROK family protein [Actinobacteria bacterium]|nr:ROK family protein [Actinomycetota bacterium]
MGPVMGIDIGGSGIKGAPVDVESGELTGDRVRIPTPDGAKPHPVAEVVARVVGSFQTEGPVGCTFPAVVVDGVARTAANVDSAWVGTNAASLFGEATGRDVLVINDADAAGLAEMRFGAGRGHDGVVVMLTLGTGIGSAVFLDGKLVPNTEFGHLEIRGKRAEHRASDRTREEHALGWHEWAERLDEVLDRIEALLSPSLFILGGGVSKKSDRFIPLLSTQAPVVPAALLNNAGIVGAALAVHEAGALTTAKARS